MLLRSLVNKTARDWDLKLAQAEFGYNRSMHRTTKHSPFEIVYGMNPCLPIDYVNCTTNDAFLNVDAAERVKAFKKMHDPIREQIEKSNARYKEQANKHKKPVNFKERDLV